MFGTENEPKISEWKKKTRGIEHFFWGVGWKMNCLGKKMKPKISERKNRLGENEIVTVNNFFFVLRQRPCRRRRRRWRRLDNRRWRRLDGWTLMGRPCLAELMNMNLCLRYIDKIVW